MRNLYTQNFKVVKVRDDERRVLDAMAKMANFQLMIEQELQDYMDEDEQTPKDKIRVVINNDVI